MPEVIFVAGESSGDLHAAGVAAELKQLRPDLDLTGFGGPLMEAAGVDLFDRYESGVMGFVEVIRHIPRHYFLLENIRERMQRGAVALMIVVDYPGFNMKAADAASEAGVPVLYYITPQVWAWGQGRIPKLARIVSKAAVILPFEENLLRGHGIDATFVGHPLLDRAGELPSRSNARKELGLSDTNPVLALFPGSREQEIDRHLDDFVDAAKEVQKVLPGVQVVVSVAPTVEIDPDRCPYRLVHSASFAVLRAADAALCKSGTTTLEAAIADCPLAVAYRTSEISYILARFMVTIEHIGLVNVVAGREVAREFVQDELEPRKVAAQLLRLLDVNDSERARVLEGLAEVRGKLGTPGAARRVAEMASALAQ
ncbi:MAG TPA: lipid-A-disaccharide synthase [Gemmatimonadaceae bacterium]|nr:lipid-A-disaccharide synthase [Gemmatimonadaceae bacterium]